MMRIALNGLAVAALGGLQPAAAGELESLAWLSGHWVSEDGTAEEVWLAPRDGSMAGSFRWVFPDGDQVLEYLVIEETPEAVWFRFKHFGTDYEPWEKDAPNTYRLEGTADGSATFVRTSTNDRAPLRIVYSRQGDRLTFRGEGDAGEDPLVLSFKLR